VPCGVAIATAFVANAFSQSIGLALLTGTAVRLRAYDRYDLDAAAVARVSAFVTLSATLGLLAMGAGAVLASGAPVAIGQVSLSARPLGVLLAIVVLAYLGWSGFGSRAAVGRRGWSIDRPTLAIALQQVAVASFDWLLTGTVLFLVLPLDGIGYGTVLRVYLLSQTVGTISHVPGGAGVFELFVLTLLRPLIPPNQQVTVVASLVAFRVLYYLLPLVAALLVASFAESRAVLRARAELHAD